jgi:hypothetical protein
MKLKIDMTTLPQAAERLDQLIDAVIEHGYHSPYRSALRDSWEDLADNLIDLREGIIAATNTLDALLREDESEI